MKNIFFLLLTFFLIINTTNVNAELPYESDQEHNFVLTGGLTEKNPFSDSFHKIFSFTYSFQNKISGGISYRDYNVNYRPQYDAITEASILQSGGTLPENNSRNSFTNLYAQVKPFNMLQIKTPVSFSIFVAVQDVTTSNRFIAIGYIYKKFTLNQKHSIQPILSIGYRDISIVAGGRNGKYGGGLIYSYTLNEQTSILIAPQINIYEDNSTYSVQAGLSYGLGK